jgi:cobalt-zinc-cadmium efflux system membrane fusion protein
MIIRGNTLRVVFIVCTLCILSACSHDPKPAQAKPQPLEAGVFEVAHPEQFKLAQVEERPLPSTLTANGTVNPDASRTIRVTSLGSGRVMDLKVRLGDFVQKGQSLLVISSPDLAGAVADYQKAVADEALSRKALERAQLLYSRGAIAQKDLEAAQAVEDKAKVDMAASEQHVRVLGGDPSHPSPMIDLRAPVAGTIVEQNVAGFEGVKSIDNTPNLFTIADLSQVWVVCDVYENDLGEVHLGDTAEIRLNAFPDRVFRGPIANISRILDPNTRSAKVRVVLPNTDGVLSPGMFAVATFQSRKLQGRMVVPQTTVMRLQDKDWVFVQQGEDRFRRVAVQTASVTPDGLQVLDAGVKPGDKVVLNALEFSTAVAEKKD